MEEKLKKAIELTREYGRRFGVEYTDSEINERLISDKIYELRITNYELRTNKVYLDKMDLAKKLAKDIGVKFRDISFLGVTGSVAAGRPPTGSDIDLMVITKRNSLWLTRLRLRIYIWWKKIPHRKYARGENSNEFCFNLWMEEDCLDLPKDKQNLKNAMDLILMKPILNRNETYEKFMIQNSWAIKFVATGYDRLVTNYELRITNYENDLIKKILNWLVFWPQWWYMKRKIGGGLVNLKMAFFHPKGE